MFSVFGRRSRSGPFLRAPEMSSHETGAVKLGRIVVAVDSGQAAPWAFGIDRSHSDRLGKIHILKDSSARSAGSAWTT